jgi:uncharacterized iron-regulated protein
MSGCTFTSPSNLALQPGVTKSLKMNEDTCSQYLLSAPGQNSCLSLQRLTMELARTGSCILSEDKQSS